MIGLDVERERESGNSCCCCIPIIITLIYELQWMNERTHFFIKIYLSYYSRKGRYFCGVWEMGGGTYTKREDFFFPYHLPGARGCQRLHPLASSSETPLIGCVSQVRLRFSAPRLKQTAWFSSRDPLPVTHLFDLSALTRRHLLVY